MNSVSTWQVAHQHLLLRPRSPPHFTYQPLHHCRRRLPLQARPFPPCRVPTPCSRAGVITSLAHNSPRPTGEAAGSSRDMYVDSPAPAGLASSVVNAPTASVLTVGPNAIPIVTEPVVGSAPIAADPAVGIHPVATASADDSPTDNVVSDPAVSARRARVAQAQKAALEWMLHQSRQPDVGSSVDDIEDDHSCPVCGATTGAFVMPMCGHDLCKSCMLNHQREREVGRACPSCKARDVLLPQWLWLCGAEPTADQRGTLREAFFKTKLRVAPIVYERGNAQAAAPVSAVTARVVVSAADAIAKIPDAPVTSNPAVTSAAPASAAPASAPAASAAPASAAPVADARSRTAATRFSPDQFPHSGLRDHSTGQRKEVTGKRKRQSPELEAVMMQRFQELEEHEAMLQRAAELLRERQAEVELEAALVAKRQRLLEQQEEQLEAKAQALVDDRERVDAMAAELQALQQDLQAKQQQLELKEERLRGTLARAPPAAPPRPFEPTTDAQMLERSAGGGKRRASARRGFASGRRHRSRRSGRSPPPSYPTSCTQPLAPLPSVDAAHTGCSGRSPWPSSRSRPSSCHEEARLRQRSGRSRRSGTCPSRTTRAIAPTNSCLRLCTCRSTALCKRSTWSSTATCATSLVVCAEC